MTQLTKKEKNGSAGRSPSSRNDFFNSRLFAPRLFDFDDDFFSRKALSPPANISETSKEFKLELSVPGMKREDFKIDIENGVLTVSSETENEKNEEDENYFVREFSYSSFSRNFTLPENIDEAGISAKYVDGMLQVIIPKKEATPSKPKKQINIE